MIFDNGENGSVGGGTVDVGDIKNSLRFRATNSADMNRAMTTGNGSKYTLSWAMKIGVVPNNTTIFEAGTSATTRTNIGFSAAGNLQFYDVNTSTRALVTSTATFRDVGGWYFFTVIVDTTLAIATDRIILMCNGVRLAVTISTQIPINTVTFMNGPYTHRINGLVYAAGGYNDCYMARICFVDGAASPATSFGYLNTTSNSWVTLSQSTCKAVVDAGGVNSFMLDFDNGASLTTLGADKSVKGNNWTLNNMSITAGPTYDWMLDTPSNNFPTLNNLFSGGMTVEAGNLRASIVSGNTKVPATMLISIPAYCEILISSGTGNMLGFSSDGQVTGYPGGTANSYGLFQTDGRLYNNAVAGTVLGTYTTGDIIQLARDPVSGKLWFGKNGVWLGSGDPATGANPAATNTTPMFFACGCSGGADQQINFGQRPFTYTVPTGFKALCTQNLSTPNVAALTPPNQFNIALDTGAAIKSTSEAIFPNNFFEWIKNRGAVNNHQLLDTVRGNTAVLQSNTTAAETTYVAPANASVGWVWKAGGTASTNTNGTVTSQVSANTDAGFSVVTYTGAAGSYTIGHGLSTSPRLIIYRARTSGVWVVMHASLANMTTSYLVLNTTAVPANLGVTVTAPTATTFGGSTTSVLNGDPAVAYCFSEISGYSKIGSYTGNGSADGPFIYCGFRPRFLLVKRTDTASDWLILDSARNTVNVLSSDIYANSTNAEGTNATADFCSNGVKLRTTGAWANASGGTYVYYTVAESTINYSNAR